MSIASSGWILFILVLSCTVSQTKSNTELSQLHKHNPGSMSSIHLAATLAEEGLALCSIADKIPTLFTLAAPWLKNTSLPAYSSGSPVWCSWTGITCESTSFTVTSIDLGSKSLKAKGGLSKTTLQSLSVLTNINRLVLSGNSLSKAIPTSIGYLTSLTMLDLSAQSTPYLTGG